MIVDLALKTYGNFGMLPRLWSMDKMHLHNSHCVVDKEAQICNRRS